MNYQFIFCEPLDGYFTFIFDWKAEFELYVTMLIAGRTAPFQFHPLDTLLRANINVAVFIAISILSRSI